MKQYNNILISGASSGIGAMLVRRFAQQGKTIGLLALPNPDLYRIQVEATQLGAKAVYPYPLDVCDRNAVRNAVKDFVTNCGGIDLWIACAGIDEDVALTGFNNASAQKIEQIYDVNLKGLMFGTNAVLEYMLNKDNKRLFKKIKLPNKISRLHTKLPIAKRLTRKKLTNNRLINNKLINSRLINKTRANKKQANKKLTGKGHIVGISSLAGQNIFPSHADYSASKTAVDAYLQSLRVRLAQTNIKITTVSPGFVKTPMTQAHTHPMPFIVSTEQAVDEILNGIAKGHEQISFPKPLVISTKILKILPKSIWKKVARLSALLS